MIQGFECYHQGGLDFSISSLSALCQLISQANSLYLLANVAFGDSKLPQSPAQGSGKTMFQLIVMKSLLKVSDIKQLFLRLMESRDQGFR